MPTERTSHVQQTWEKVMALGSDQSETAFRMAAVTVVVLGLYASSLYSYILFHSLIEITTIAIALTLFTLTWNARRFLTGGCLKAIGIGYGFIALVDLIHSLAYKGMGVFPGYGANLPTQLWIAARFLQALLLCLAPLLARRNFNERVFFAISLAAVSSATALVYSGGFPDCFIEGSGLTPFKIVSEYVISALLFVSLLLFIDTRTTFDTRVFALIVVSILCTIGSELAFTSYVNVYGPANMAGHFLKLAAFYLIYRALVVTGFLEPFDLIFRDLKQAEQALTQEREFSRCLLESMVDGVVACDANGMLTLFNRSAREWHGMDPLRLPPDEWAQHYDLFRQDGITPLPTDEIPLARAFRGEMVRDAGMAIKAKDQPIRFILANGSVILDEAGQKLGAVVIMRDVTAFGRLEQELRKTNEELEKRVEERTEELRQINQQLQIELAERGRIENALLLTQFSVDHAADGIMWIRPDGRYCYANETISRLLGYSSEELLRMKASDLNLAHPLEVWPSHWEELKRSKTLFFETTLIRKDGLQLPVEIHANHVAFGDQEYNCASVRDISERKWSEAALRKRESELNESQRLAHIGSWDWDAVNDVIWWSDEYYHIYGLDPNKPTPNYDEHLLAYTPESAQRLDGAVKRAMRAGEPYELDLELAVPTETTRWIVARGETKRDADGKICGLRGTAQNITERKKAEEEIRKLNEGLEKRVRERTAELQEKNAELERANKLFVGRELRMIELKERIRELEKEAGRSSATDDN